MPKICRGVGSRRTDCENINVHVGELWICRKKTKGRE